MREDKTLEWIVKPLLQWYDKKARELPWRVDVQPYRVWISEIMLQQTRVEAVIPYYNRFMDAFPHIKDLADAEEEKVLKLWEGLGYYSRARNLKKSAEIIRDKYNGEFPKEYKEILKLLGIGKYTAGAISSIAYGMPYAAVDGNVLRVISRICESDSDIGDEKFRNQMKEELERIYPHSYCSQFTQSLMELGAVVCIPNGAPKCEECPLNEGCGAFQNNSWNKYPVKNQKVKRKKINKTVLLLYCNGKVAVQKKQGEGLLAGLYEFPNIDIEMKETDIQRWLNDKSIESIQIQKYKKVKHIFTHLEWDMCCYKVECRTDAECYEWFSAEELQNNLPLPTAFRKCL